MVVALRFDGEEYEPVTVPGIVNGSEGRLAKVVEALLMIIRTGLTFKTLENGQIDCSR